MYIKRLLMALVLVLLSLLVIPSSIVVAVNDGPTPHENPDIAEVHFDGIAILGYHTWLLDNVLARDPAQVESLREKTPFANIPQGLEEPFENFGNASVNIAWLIPEIDSETDDLNMLARQFRLEEMEAQRQQTQDKLTQAYGQLSVIEESAAIAAEELGVASAGKGSPLGMAYEELQDRIDQIRKLLGLFQKLLEAIPESTLLVLRPTEITLVMELTGGFVGDWLDFEGRLSSQGAVLPSREVVLLLDGGPYLTVQTGQDGSYQGQFQIPYNYVPRLTLQALYYPQGNDVGIYLASKSLTTEIQVFFYTATLQLGVEGESYPGLDSTLYGQFDYGDQPIPAAREIQIYVEKKLVSQTSVGSSFEQKISLSPEMALGERRVSVIAPAWERYAPVTSETVINVVTVPPIIDVSPPRVAIMPFALNLEGRIYSKLGPVEGAVVDVGLGSRKAQAVTSNDGTFTVKLGTGMNLSLIGSQELRLEVNPEKPWNSPASSSWRLITVNPILIALVALALGAIIVAMVKRLRIRATRPVSVAVGAIPGVLATKPADVVSAPVSLPTSPQREGKDLRQLTFELYRRLLRLLQEFTGIVLKPHVTLREFATQCAPLLGPAHRYLDQFTRLIERLLYSKHTPETADLENSQELSGLVEESLRHERA